MCRSGVGNARGWPQHPGPWIGSANPNSANCSIRHTLYNGRSGTVHLIADNAGYFIA
jgi:hypothetical protein